MERYLTRCITTIIMQVVKSDTCVNVLFLENDYSYELLFLRIILSVKPN